MSNLLLAYHKSSIVYFLYCNINSYYICKIIRYATHLPSYHNISNLFWPWHKKNEPCVQKTIPWLHFYILKIRILRLMIIAFFMIFVCKQQQSLCLVYKSKENLFTNIYIIQTRFFTKKYTHLFSFYAFMYSTFSPLRK